MLALVGRPRPDSRQIFIYCYLFMFVNAKCYILFAILRRLTLTAVRFQLSKTTANTVGPTMSAEIDGLCVPAF